MSETKKFLSVMLLSFLIVSIIIIQNKKEDVIDITESFPSYTMEELNCMTQAIYYEAGNQSEFGKQAVAKVIINRVNHGSFANNVCDVISQSKIVNNRKICQFSYFCSRMKKPNENIWQESENIAKKALQNEFDYDILEKLSDALYFHANYVNPTWFRKVRRIAQIEDHIFYGDKNERKTN